MKHDVGAAIANLDAWLQTMRQPGGYGGPVVHWWQNRMQYTGPGLDWRYEGILIGYATLHKKTGHSIWLDRLQAAVDDLATGQRSDGSFRASRFELNPGALGTPHEAAASFGLLVAASELPKPSVAVETAVRNLRHLIDVLWDGTGFNDRPHSRERVPNKLATLAHALMLATERTGDETFLPYARACLEDVLRFQEHQGELDGAIHQYAPGADSGDDRFFPYYNARCVPPLVKGAEQFGDERYLAAAHAVLSFLRRTMTEDGSWPQVVYRGGPRAKWPRWYAGVADVLLAFHMLDEPIPTAAMNRLLSSKLSSGAFRTARGFSSQATQRQPAEPEDVRDALPVVGWNDKPLRLMAVLSNGMIAPASVAAAEVPIDVRGEPAVLRDTDSQIAIERSGVALYDWRKSQPWARVPYEALMPR